MDKNALSKMPLRNRNERMRQVNSCKKYRVTSPLYELLPNFTSAELTLNIEITDIGRNQIRIVEEKAIRAVKEKAIKVKLRPKRVNLAELAVEVEKVRLKELLRRYYDFLIKSDYTDSPYYVEDFPIRN